MLKPTFFVLTDQPDLFQQWLDESVAKALSKVIPGVALAAPATDQLLTIEEACREFGISKATLNEWRTKNIVPFIRLGRRIYFERAQVLAAGRSHNKYQRREQS